MREHSKGGARLGTGPGTGSDWSAVKRSGVGMGAGAAAMGVERSCGGQWSAAEQERSTAGSPMQKRAFFKSLENAAASNHTQIVFARLEFIQAIWGSEETLRTLSRLLENQYCAEFVRLFF